MTERPGIAGPGSDPRIGALVRPDHPPTHDQFPTWALVAVVDDMTAALAAVAAARAAGGGDAYVLAAGTVLLEDEERRAHHSLLAAALQLMGELVSDQRSIQDRYVAQAKAGHHMVVAAAADDVTVDRVWAALRSQGAHDGSWYGRRSIRELL
jgi:hypothetical protein